MAQHAVGEAQVALGVLEVDRVDLVRHGGRADLAGLQLLLEVAQEMYIQMSRQISSTMVLARAVASNSSAIASWGSIWMV